jgi:Zn-dependent protease with chaperone function
MSDGKVISVYLLTTFITGLIPVLIWHNAFVFISFAMIVVIWWSVAAVYGDKILLWSIRAEPLNVGNYKELVEIINKSKNGVSMRIPSLWRVGDHSPMVMSIGLDPKSSHLLLTRGLLERFDDKVQRGLIVRELQSIKSGKTAVNTAGATVLWFILLPGKLVNLIIGNAPGEPNLVATIVNFFPSILGAIVANILSDKRTVYEIDKDAMRMLDNPGYLPYAFKELTEKQALAPFNVELALSPCCVVNQNSSDPFAGMFKTLPSTPKRIERLLSRLKS